MAGDTLMGVIVLVGLIVALLLSVGGIKAETANLKHIRESNVPTPQQERMSCGVMLLIALIVGMCAIAVFGYGVSI